MRVLLMTSLFLLAAPAVASDPATPAQRPARGSPEEVVCHREAVTGSLARVVRTCMTRAGWQKQAEANQAAVDQLDQMGRINACTSPGGCERDIGPTPGVGGPG